MPARSWRRLTPGLLLGLAATVASAQTPAPPTAAPAPAPVATAAPQPSLLQPKGPQAGFGDLLVLGTGGGFALAPAAAGQVPLIDGVQVTEAALSGPWQPGRHAVALESTPVPGAEATVQPPLQFVYDPAPPKVQWEIGTTAMLEVHGLDEDVHVDHPPHRIVPKADKRVRVIWSPDGRRWLPLLPADAKPGAGGALVEWLEAADRPQIFLWALESPVFGAGAPVQPQKLQLVRVWVTDELSAVRDLKLRVVPSPSGGYLLEMLATDLVGNATSVTWPLAG
jgi:hypothetical protein